MSQFDSSGDDRLDNAVRTMSFGTLWRVLRYPFVLLTLAVVPRLMGCESDYGKYALFVALMVIWDTVARIGTTQIFGRFLPAIPASDTARRSRLLHTVMFYGVLLTAVVIGLGWMFVVRFGIEGFEVRWLPALAAVLLLSKIEGTLFGFLYGMNQIGRFSAKETLRSAFTFAFVVGLYRYGGLEAAFWGLVANEAVMLVIGSYWTRDYLFTKPSLIGFKEFTPFLVFGIAFYVPTFLFGLLQRSGNVFVSELTCSYEQISFYDVANQFLLLLGMFFRQFMAALLPSLTVLHERRDEEGIQRWQRTALAFCGVLAFLALHALILFGRPVLTIWLGSDIAGAEVHRNAVIVGLSLLPLLVSQAGLNIGLLDKRPRAYVWSVLGGLIALAVVSTWLVPQLGARGAAWATLAGYGVSAAVFCGSYGLRLISSLGRLAAITAVGCLFIPLYTCGFRPAVALAVFVASSLAYLAVLFAVKLVRLEDITNVVSALRGRQ